MSSLAHEPEHETLMVDRSEQHVWPAPHGVVGQSMPPPLELPLPEPLPLELPLPELLPLELPLPELLPLELPLPELPPLELPLPEPLPLELPLPLPEPLPLELPLPPPEPLPLPLPLLLVASPVPRAPESGIEKFPVPSMLSPQATAEIAQATATDRPRKTHMLHGIVRGKRPTRSPPSSRPRCIRETMALVGSSARFGRALLVAGLAGCGSGSSGAVQQASGDAGAVADTGSDAGAADVSTADGVTPDGGSPGTPHVTTFTPVALPSSGPELTDPLRGQYEWLGTSPYPAGWTDVDSYQRWNWAQLEPSQGNYVWALIDDELAAAKARHGRFGMRFMPLCQGCGDHVYMGAQSSIPDDLASASNPLIAAAPGGGPELYVLPDWNSSAYLSRLQELLSAIGARYGNDPTFAWVDVSSYGNWGEFHLYPFTQAGGPYDTSTQRPITDANARRIVQMNAAAFPNKLLVINSEQAAALAEAVATPSPPIGLRVDCLGSDGLAGGQSAIAAAAGASERWRTAPFITEWCQTNLGSSGADLFVQGEQQVRDFHVSMLSSGNFASNPTTGAEVSAFRTANVEAGYRLRIGTLAVTFDPGKPAALGLKTHWVDDNVAPTYLTWKVVFGLTGAAKVEMPLTVDLRKVMPDAALDDVETVTSSSALPHGSYQAYVRVVDAQGISVPMNLAMQGRDTSGNYVLGTLTIP